MQRESIHGPARAGPADGDAGAILTIDLAALQANWRLLAERAAGAECAGVVKADAYGLGLAQVGPALAAAGCRTFFVAHVAEGVALRALLPEATIHVLHGLMASDLATFVQHALTPVLNTLEGLDAWARRARRAGRRLPATLQVDTGMARMGLPLAQARALVREPARWDGLDIGLVMSHLACAEEPDHPFSAVQRERFEQVRRAWPRVRASLANSSGIFLGGAWHYDLVRPGAALYGVAPVAGAPNPMQPVVRLQARVIQVHAVAAGDTVGYGCGWTAPGPARIATVCVGYADGYLRSAGNRGCAWLDGTRLPLAGKVSMDSITLDVSALPPGRLRPGDRVDLIDARHGVDAVAADAGTIGYEILTSIGHRYARHYLGA